MDLSQLFLHLFSRDGHVSLYCSLLSSGFNAMLFLCADKLFGVFHVRSKAGQYKLTYAAAQQVCIIEGGSLATLSQLHHAQQVSEDRTAREAATDDVPSNYCFCQGGLEHVCCWLVGPSASCIPHYLL